MFHILQSSQASGPVLRVECELISRIVGLSISDATEANLTAMRQGNVPGHAKKRWLDFLF